MVWHSQHNEDLVAVVRSLARLHHSVTNERVSAAAMIKALRDRGKNAEADELESAVERIKAERAASHSGHPDPSP
jgi:hypothetical protein